MSHVFHIPIEGESIAAILKHLTDKPREWGSYWIVTANPEILLEARRDAEYAKTLQQADLRVVDGFGLWALLRLAGQKVERVTGVDLAEVVLDQAQKEGWRVGFVGGGSNVAQKARTNVQKRFPSLEVHTEEGGRVGVDGTGDDVGEEARHRLVLFAPHVLFVAFGHPKQERWIAKYLADFPSVKVVIGVGGTFDYWAGTVRRAPPVLRVLGLEWLWRLILEPRRFKRIWNAVVVFPVLFLLDSFRKS